MILARVLLLLAVCIPALPLEARQPPAPEPDLEGSESAVRARLEQLQSQLRTRPSDGALWGLYGMALEAHDFTTEAKQAYSRAHDLDPTDFRWPYLYASLEDQSDPAEALGWHQLALQINPGYAPAYVRLGETYERLQRLDQAERAFAEASRLGPKNPFGPLGLGRLALHRGDLDSAIQHLERATELGPELKSALVTLAQAYQQAGRRADATRVIDLARPLPRTNYRPDEIRAVVKDQAVDARGELRKARSAQERGDLATARRALEQAIQLDPSLATAHFTLAQVLALQGERLRAVDSARQALSLDNDLPGVSAFLASTFFGLELFEEAEREARRALELDPGNAHMMLTLSMVAADRGETDRAVALVQRAFEARSRESETRRLLSGLLAAIAGSFEEAGLFEEAVHHLESLLTLAVEDGEDDASLEQLRRRIQGLRGRR